MSRDLGVPFTDTKPYFFVSYNSEDQQRVSEFAKALSDFGLPLWYDEGLIVGKKWEESITEHIFSSEAVIMFITKKIFSKMESYVHKEYEIAKFYSKKIIIVTLDNITNDDIPPKFVSWWIDVKSLQCIEAAEGVSTCECAKSIIAASNFKINICDEYEIELTIGSIIDNKFQIVDIINDGALSSIFLAENIRTKKKWIIRDLVLDNTNKELYHNQIKAEINIMNERLNHPSLPSVVDMYTYGSHLLLIIDYVEGTPISQISFSDKHECEKFALKTAIHICNVVKYLHMNNCIDNDIRPTNILIRVNGEISLLGHSVSYGMLLKELHNVGSIHFMAPEVYSGSFDCRADIYSIGLTIKRILFKDNILFLTNNSCDRCIDSTFYSPCFLSILDKCTELSPENRYQNINELLNDLRKLSDDLLNIPSTPKNLFRKIFRKNN